jgi:ABC-type uncharacterized transport system involved in gliding motility auxiliary subunit
MKRFIDVLAPIGFLVAISPQLFSRFGRMLPGKPEYYLFGGLALIVAHIVLRWDDILAAVGRRQMRYGTNTFVLTLAVLVVLGLLNYLVNRHTKRWDLTKNQRYSLSDQTKKVVRGIKDEITIWYFNRGPELAAGQDRMKEFQAASPKLKIEFLDPIANPARAQSLDARGPWPTLVVERGSKREKISNDSEQDVTNAIIKVTREGKKTVCFLEGEGERDIDDSGDRGVSGLKSALGKSQYEAKKVHLMHEGKVPGDCTVLVVAGPEKDVLPPVVDSIRAFVKGGGKAMLMVEPELKESYPNLAGLLKEWNIEAGRDVVVDVSPIGQLFGTGELTPLAAQYPYHEITKDFRVTTAFHTARSMAAGSGTVEGVTAQNLVETSPASWAETDLSLKGEIAMDEGKDKKGPISLGVVATVKVGAPSPAPSTPASPEATPSPAALAAPSPPPSPEPGEEAPKKEGRVAAFGDSDFVSNALLGFQGNRDFALNTVAWLSEDVDLISIRPKEPDDQRMFLTRAQQQNVAWLALVFLPGAFVVLGIASWWRRRG